MCNKPPGGVPYPSLINEGYRFAFLARPGMMGAALARSGFDAGHRQASASFGSMVSTVVGRFKFYHTIIKPDPAPSSADPPSFSLGNLHNAR
jgi:hypothetical protein